MRASQYPVGTPSSVASSVAVVDATSETRAASTADVEENARRTSSGGTVASTAMIGPTMLTSRRSAATKKGAGAIRPIIESLPKLQRPGEAERWQARNARRDGAAELARFDRRRRPIDLHLDRNGAS